MKYNFPDDFIFGAATASYQVEGAVNEDGRSPSVWDIFSHTPGKVKNNDNADTSCDQYHKYKEDILLMKDIGLQAYRFSTSWSRVLPDGRGKPNRKGLDYYSNLVDNLLEKGIEPWVTLFHWDFPQVLQDEYDGWLSRKSIDDFAEYASLMAKTLGDRVTNWFTMNEFDCFTDKSSLRQEFAPDFKATGKEAAQIRHNAMVAHGKAIQALRASSPGTVRVGMAENSLCTIPVFETPEHIAAAKKAFRDINARFTTPIMEGAYDPGYLEYIGSNAPDIEPGDMETMSTKTDFFGLNMYTPVYIKAGGDLGWQEVHMSADHPKAKPAWLRINPSIGYWTTRFIKELWNVNEIYITENGASFDDIPDQNGKVNDTARIMYLREHLKGIHRAIDDGIPVKGYFLWSLLDNFEWKDGFDERFGIIHVDYKTLKRTPKLSAEYYSQVIKNRSVV